jgi:hypothetical protein
MCTTATAAPRWPCKESIGIRRVLRLPIETIEQALGFANVADLVQVLGREAHRVGIDLRRRRLNSLGLADASSCRRRRWRRRTEGSGVVGIGRVEGDTLCAPCSCSAIFAIVGLSIAFASHCQHRFTSAVTAIGQSACCSRVYTSTTSAVT